MRYVYTLTNDDLLKMGIETTNAKDYSIEQSGWDGKFGDMYEWFDHTYQSYKGHMFQGERRGNVIIKGKDLTLEQRAYIIQNCSCKEYGC